MTRSNVVFDSIMKELKKVSEAEDIRAEEEEEDRASSDGDTDVDAFPPSLLRYFECSKRRAVECEKLILRPEDYFESRRPEEKINQLSELTDEGVKQNDGVIHDQDLGLLTASPDTEGHHAYRVSMCPSDEGDAETDADMQTETDSVFEERTVKSLEGDGYEAEREKLRCEELEREQQRRQREDDFQKELQRIMEAEKLQQMELQRMEKKAQEKLEQEMLLQQEVISSLQRRVEEERKRLEEEKKRLKEEEDERKSMKEERKRLKEEEYKRREEEERKRMEEEKKRLKEEEEERRKEKERKKMEKERKRLEEEEDKRREEEERKRMEEEKERLKEEEEKRKRMEEEKKRLKENEKERRKEEERKKMEEEQKILKEEEDKRKEEEERKRMETEKRRREEERRRKEEEMRKREEERMRKETERRKLEEEERRTEEERKNKEKEEKSLLDIKKRKLQDDMRMRREGDSLRKEEERKEATDRRQKEEAFKMEKSKNKQEVTKTEKEDLGKDRKVAEDQRKKKDKERTDEEKLRKQDDKEEKNRVMKEDGRKREEQRSKIDFEKVKVKDKVKEKEEKMEPERMKKDDDERTRAGDVTEEKERSTITMKNTNQAEGKRDEKENEKQDIISQDGKQREEEKNEDERMAKMEKNVTKDKEENITSLLVEDVEKKKDDKRNTREEDQTQRRVASDSKEEEKMKIRMNDEPSSERGDRILNDEDKERFKRSDQAKRKEELQGEIKSKKENWKEAKMEEDQMEDRVGEQNEEGVGGNVKEADKETGEEIRVKEKEKNKRKETEHRSINEKNHKDKAETVITKNSAASSTPGPSTVSSICTRTAPQQCDQDKITAQTSMYKTPDCKGPFESFPVCLPEHTEQKRLSWMKECVPWSRLSLLNKRKRRGSSHSGRGTRRAAEASGLPPLCPGTLLQSTGWPSLKEVTTVTLEDLPGCSLSTLSQCPQLQSLTLRRCGLKSLEGINHLQQLCSIDVQENDISFINCENMKSLRVLKLSYNKLTSIHGLTGAENLAVLELSHNSITRIAGLESLRTLQRLSLDHNQLIGTKGLKDIYTLLHLSCSHNHLVKVEGLEDNVLLNTLDLSANSLTEPPSLNNHVLLRELRLDDNSISSLQSLSARWLPLTQHLSVAQNRMTQLPPMSDFVSLQSLDLRFNCLSDLRNVNESLEGCQFLQVLHLKGNPLQQESGWRSSLQKALPGLKAVDDQDTDPSPLPPAVGRFSLTSGSFFTFCQAQLRQTRDLHEQHCRELSQASTPLAAIKTSCQHFTEALQLAEDQRFAHEYGNTSVYDAVDRTTHEEIPDNGAEEHTRQTEMQFVEKSMAVASKRDIFHCSYWTLEEKPPLVDRRDTESTVTAGLRTEQTACEVKSSRVKSSATKENRSSSNCVMDSITINQDLNLQNRAAVVIQQMWRKYWQKCGNIGGMSTAERGGDGGGDEGGGGGPPESGPSLNNRDVLGRESAATAIQAVWRGFTLRRRLTSALAAVSCSDIGEDDTFEEVDVDEFVFDETALEEQWTPLCEDQPPRCYSESEQLLSLKPPGAFTEPTQKLSPHPLVWRSKQAWVDEQQEVSAEQKVLPVNFNRAKSPPSAPLLSGLSERSEQILEEWGFTNSHTALLMLKRAQKMTSKKQQQKNNPSTHLALFKTCTYHKDPAEAQKRPAKHNRNSLKAVTPPLDPSSVPGASPAQPGPASAPRQGLTFQALSQAPSGVTECQLGLQQTPRTEGTRQDKVQQWPHARAAHVDNYSESVHFLPEISSDILHGGRVQLVADLGYSERQHHAKGSWANSSLAARPCRENRHLQRNSSGREASSPKRVSSTPSKKERISFRDNPVQLSGGWGGGKKRDRENK